MFKFISTYRLQISVLAAILGLFVLLFQSYKEQGSSRIQIAIQTVTYPFQASVQSAVSNFKNLWNSYILLIDVNEENNRLKQQLLDLEEKLSEHIENSVQFRRLRDQMLFARKNPLEKIYAEIIGMVGAFYSTNRIPVTLPIIIAITALCRLIVMQSKEMGALIVLGEAGAILILSIAAIIMSFKDKVSLEKIKELRDSVSSE